jgi:N-acetylneuraminic acid mutarotase
MRMHYETGIAAFFCLMISALAQAEKGLNIESLAQLPKAMSNNAVSLLVDGDGYRLVSALGLAEGKSWKDSSSESWQYKSSSDSWRQMQNVPGLHGRLAASAMTVGGKVYLFGGYTVAEDGSEASTAEVYVLNSASGAWSEFSHMPVATEDAVLLSYQDRYVYLVSGWHDLGNINLVQVLDTETASWSQATPYPGAAVFGHAGAIAGANMVVCDGVRIKYPSDATARQFLSSTECWMGQIDSQNYRRIVWQSLPPHPGPARYRMASGSDDSGRIWFVGGSDNPYNFDGMGYNSVPSEPLGNVFSYKPAEEKWQCHGRLSVATMDHRGLPWHDGWFYLIGGMRAGQKVSRDVFRFRPLPMRQC